MSTRPYNCRYPGCSKIFKWRSHRNRHERYAHSPPKYRCPISDCNQSFMRKDYLSTISNMSTTLTGLNSFIARIQGAINLSNVKEILKFTFATCTVKRYSINVLIPTATKLTDARAHSMNISASSTRLSTSYL